jgi:hypothetical protein
MLKRIKAFLESLWNRLTGRPPAPPTEQPKDGGPGNPTKPT